MQLWLVSGSEVSIREQLVTQIRLAIVSGDLTSGQRLPSTRELARRFQVHPNTVSGPRSNSSCNKKQEHEAYGVGAAALLPRAAFFPAINRGMAVHELVEQFEISPQFVEYRIKITGAHALYRARQRARC
jgi:Bacterial regulatory proteins, gntR family/IrrE N-terminal-like domain